MRDELGEHVRDVHLAFGREGFRVACPAAEGDHDGLGLAHSRLRSHYRGHAENRAGSGGPYGAAQELTPAEALPRGEHMKRFS